MSRASRRNAWRRGQGLTPPPPLPAFPEVRNYVGEIMPMLQELKAAVAAYKSAAVGAPPVVPSGALVRPAFDGPWRAFVSSSSATTFTVVDKDGNPPRILSSATNLYENAIVEFLGPGMLTGVRTTISSVSFANNVLTVTVGDNLPAPVMSGDQFILLRDPLAANISGFPLGAVVTMQNAASATGQGTALPVSGDGVALIAVSGTFSATITWQGVGPDGNTYTVEAQARNGGTVATTATTTGLFEVNARGLSSVYANITTYASGSVTVKGTAQPLGAATQQLSLAGSTPPHTVGAPTLLTTIPYTVLAANTTYYTDLSQVFTRTASARTFGIVSTIGVAWTPQMEPYDSTWGSAYGGSGDIFSGSALPAQGTVEITFDSGPHPVLAAKADSTNFAVEVGSTAPTGGNIKLYVIEFFG